MGEFVGNYEGPESVQRVRNWYGEAESEYEEFIRKADRNLMFFWNDQWDDKDRYRARQQGRPMVVIPIVKPMIKLIWGMQMQNPVEIQCSPRDAGDFIVANLNTDLIKYVADDNDLEAVDGIVFAMGLITGRSFYSVDMDYRKDIVDGRIGIREEDPRAIVMDPNGKWYGGIEDNFRMRIRWLTKEKIETIYGEDKTKDLVRDLENERFPTEDKSPFYTPSGKYETYKVIECWWKKSQQSKTIWDQEEGKSWPVDENGMVDMRDIGVEEPADADTFMAQFGGGRYEMVKRNVPKMWVTTICGSVELEDGEGQFNDNPYCDDKFPLIAYQPLYLHGNSGSIVDDLIDLQREENLTHSQMLHMINLAANTGWVHETGALKDPRVLKDYGSTPGVIIEMAKNKMYGQHLNRIEAGKIPQLQNILNTRELAKEVTNINPAMMGLKEGEESGRAIALKQQQGMTALLPDVAPYLKTKRILGRFMLGAIQAKMPMDQAMRIVDIVQYLPSQMAQQVGQQPQLKTQLFAKLFSDYDATRYDCVAHEVPKSETRRQANWDKAKEIIQMYGPEAVPFEVAVELADLPNKEKLLERYRQQQQQMQMMQQMGQGGGAPGQPAPQGGTPSPTNGVGGAQRNPMQRSMENVIPPKELGVKPADVRQTGGSM